MAANQNVQSSNNPFLYGANADATNTATLYAPGELGVVLYDQGNTYQRVQNDSGATSATPTGIVAVGQTAFWKSKVNKIVTNDKRFAGGGAGVSANASRNLVAGIYRVAATAGYYVDVLQKGNGVQVASDATGAIGDYAVSDGTAATARVAAVANGTAPTVQIVGLIRAVAASSLISVDVDIPSVD